MKKFLDFEAANSISVSRCDLKFMRGGNVLALRNCEKFAANVFFVVVAAGQF